MRRITSHDQPAAAAFALVLLASCNPKVESADEEAERLCDAFCDLTVSCGLPDPDSGSCFDVCLEDPGWGVADGLCREDKIAYISCTNALTCGQLADDSAHSQVPQDERPCYAPRREFSLCLANAGK